VASNLHCSNDEIEPDVNIQCYPLRSDPATVLVSPLRTPPRRHRNNMVSDSSPDGSMATMNDSPPSSAPHDPATSEAIVDTLTSILT
jgi:hypothetical protein